jgi:hypothetical protein
VLTSRINVQYNKGQHSLMLMNGVSLLRLNGERLLSNGVLDLNYTLKNKIRFEF